MSQLERRANIKFCQKLDKFATETLQMIRQVYGDNVLGRSAVCKWHQHFADGTNNLEDNESVGQQQSELNGRSKRLQWWCALTVPIR